MTYFARIFSMKLLLASNDIHGSAVLSSSNKCEASIGFPPIVSSR